QVPQEMKDRILPRIVRPGVFQVAVVQAPNPDGMQLRVMAAPDGVRATLPLDFMLPLLSYRSKGKLAVVCTDPELVAKANQMATGSWDKTQRVPNLPPKSGLSGLRYDWTVEKIIVGLERNKEDPRPGGMQQMNAPPR